MNKDEERLVRWQFGYMENDSFYYSLIKAMYRADTKNFSRLAMGFPDLANAVAMYKSVEGYWDKLVAEYNKLHGTEFEP